MEESNVMAQTERREYHLAVLLFCAALAFHGWGATVGWTSLNLPGCEFRQTQTAISAFFIQHEHNFSLAYPTPVLGKPWSIPLEFPLYQWAVVWVADGLKMPLTQAGRAVSLGCFYLTLPALYWLLARIGLARSRRLLVLGLVLTCPLYIYYARAFLIETMALLFGAWFLLGYVRAVEKRNGWWLLVASVAGTGCGLVKVTTYFFFLMPAFLWTLWWFWEDWRQPAQVRGRALGGRVLWCALAVAIPFSASIWWVHYTDAIKAHSVAGNFMISSRLTAYNFGTGVRFSPDLWRQHWQVLVHDLTSVPVLVGCALLAVVFARRWWGLIGLLGLLFLAVQLIFPVLYAWHEYYYVASAFTLMVAFGLAVCGVFESRLPRVAAWAAALAVYGLQMGGYLGYYYPDQKQISNGGDNLTRALRAVMAPDEVMVIAGDDWSSIIPYYSQRRAFMIRRSLEQTWDMIHPAFAQLKGEEVTALVLRGDQTQNQILISLAAQYFQIDPRPAFQYRDMTVLLHEQIRPHAAALLRDVPGITLLDPAAGESDPLLRRELETSKLLHRYQEDFRGMQPMPFKCYTTYGTTPAEYEGRKFFSAHPDTRLWFKISGGLRTFSAEVNILPEAYGPKVLAADRSDGIELRLEEEMPDGTRALFFSKMINPRDVGSDRGIRRIEHAFELPHDGVVVLTVGPGPHGNYARDWAMLGRIEIK